MKKIFFIILSFIFIASSSLFAIPASPHPIQIVQPDGSLLSIYLKGDEYFRYKTTLDGYLIVKDAKGIFNYAKHDQNGVILSTGIKTNDIEKRKSNEKRLLKTLEPFPNMSMLNSARRAKRAAATSTEMSAANGYPLTGSPRSLVILVNFSDKKFVTSNPKEAFTKLLNEKNYSENGGTGSAKDYFRDASNGVFDPQFDVIGPFTLANKMSFYGENVNDQDKNPRQMVVDACRLADEAGIDFTEYDTDNDGKVDNVFIYYAGHNEAEGGGDETVWPHRWSLANYNTRFDGKAVFDYACTSELRGRSGSNMCGIGTFAHEFGHVLGLPDYYATDGSEHFTLDDWHIMDAGAYLNNGRTPPTYSAYDRFYLDWLKPVELINPANITLEPLLTSNKAYIITQLGNHNLDGLNPSPKEFFTLENRQKTGWDAYLPGSGMLITRINYNKNDWYNNGPNNNPNSLGYDIMEADGMASPNNLAGDPFPGTTNKSYYNPKLRDGTDINKPITYIESNEGIISFRFRGGGDVPTIKTDSELNLFSTTQGTPSAAQFFTISGKLMESEIKIAFYYKSHYQLSLNNNDESEWTKTLSIPIVNGKVDSTKVYIRYNPDSPSFENTHDEKLLISSVNADKNEINISGKSTRRVYVIPPVATEAKEVTPYSFIANWNIVKDDVKDAIGYYISVYYNSDGLDQKMMYIFKDKWVTSTKDSLYNLIPNKEYYYKVKASDKNTYFKYENITDFSNTITVKTMEDTDFKKLKVNINPGGAVTVILPEISETIYVYNTMGQKIMEISENKNIVDLQLPTGQVYILKAGTRITKIIL